MVSTFTMSFKPLDCPSFREQIKENKNIVPKAIQNAIVNHAVAEIIQISKSVNPTKAMLKTASEKISSSYKQLKNVNSTTDLLW